jgi:hypothetical protein
MVPADHGQHLGDLPVRQPRHCLERVLLLAARHHLVEQPRQLSRIVLGVRVRQPGRGERVARGFRADGRYPVVSETTGGGPRPANDGGGPGSPR